MAAVVFVIFLEGFGHVAAVVLLALGGPETSAATVRLAAVLFDDLPDASSRSIVLDDDLHG